MLSGGNTPGDDYRRSQGNCRCHCPGAGHLPGRRSLRDRSRAGFYATGNSDYAGRYVFTGYRTDTPLTFLEDTKEKYNITEQLDATKIDSITYVETGDILDINGTNFKDANNDAIANEQEVGATEVHRIRLAYKDLFYDEGDPADTTDDLGIPSIQVWNPNKQGGAGYDELKNVINGLQYHISAQSCCLWYWTK